MRSVLMFTFALGLGLASAEARAERELIVPFHEPGHLVLDQLSGLRVSSATGASYSGVLGASYRREKVDGIGDAKTTTMWFAPSADYFVTEHLSLGGTFEVSHTFGTLTVGEDRSSRNETAFSAIPRIGFFAPFGDRFGVWPRAGIGWTKSNALESVVLDLDVSLVYRFSEAFFVRTGPEVGVTLGGTRSDGDGADASVLSVSGVVGFGVNLEL